MSTSQVITCKAAVCWGIREGVKVEEIQVDPPKESEVRVKMLCASLCHTDILSTEGFPHGNYPLALGHEGVGVVESIGGKVTDLKAGDVVIPLYVGECKECENCVSGKTNLCTTYPIRITGLMPDNTSRISIRGRMAHHLLSCATWSEYMVIDAKYLLKVDPTIDVAHASFISCGFSTGFGGAWKEAKVKKGSSVAVFGLGAVGLGAISAAKMLGATKIIGIDKNEMKRGKGEAFGMTHVINPSESEKSASELVKELSGGMGVDYSIECTGVGPLLNEAMESTKLGIGMTIAIGTGSEAFVQLSLLPLLFGRSLKGSAFGGIKAISDLSIIADKCLKKFPIDELLTHEVPLADISTAFELLIACLDWWQEHQNHVCNVILAEATFCCFCQNHVTNVILVFLPPIQTEPETARLRQSCHQDVTRKIHMILRRNEIPLADISTPFELLKQPDCIKVVIKM